MIVAHLCKSLCPSQVLFFVVMTHVNHDGIERQFGGDLQDLCLILGMVKVK